MLVRMGQADASGIADYFGLHKKNGLCTDKYGDWHYYEDGEVSDYTGMALNEYGWWYILNGVLDFSYNGFGRNGDSWWYCRDGQVHFDDTDVIEGTVNGTYGWWKVVNSQVIFDNDVCANVYGWWKITDGKVILVIRVWHKMLAAGGISGMAQ